MNPQRPLLVIGLLPTIGLAGCAQAGATDIGFGGSRSEQCVHLDSGDRVLIGETILAGQHPILLDSVELVDADGVRVRGTWIIPIRGGTALGVADVPPPSWVAWADRHAVKDFPVPAKSQYNVVLEVERNSDAVGRASAIRVQGSTDGFHFDLRATTSYTFPAHCF